MKVLHVIPSYYPAVRYGGPIFAVHDLCKALAKNGIDVTVFTTNIHYDEDLDVTTEAAVNADGVSVHYFKVQRPRSWTFSFPLTVALNNRIKEFDVVHIHALWNYPIAAAAHFCRLYNVPYIICPHGLLYPYSLRKKRVRKWLYLNLIARKYLEEASAIHYTSEDEKSQVHDSLLKLHNTPAIVSYGMDLSNHSLPPRGHFRKRFRETEGKAVILFLSRINYKKGLDLLSKSYGMLARERKDVHLVIAGPDSENYKSKVEGWLRNEGVLNRVTFTGMLAGRQKLEAFVDSDCFILPSYSENFGLAVVEAMAAGLPVIVSDHVALHKEIGNARAGLVSTLDPVELYKAMGKLLDNREGAIEMGVRGQELARHRFGLDQTVKEMIHLYGSLRA